MTDILSGTREIGGSSAEQTVFARKATGLVRGWSLRDAFIYSALACNILALGVYIFSYGPFIPSGSLFWAVLLSGAYLVFQGITYAALVAAMPRAGGDYVWMSRILGGGVGFVLGICGWWFILWHWVPIYANILNIEIFGPLGAILGWQGLVDFVGTDDGVFVSSVIVAVMASAFIALGLRTYARIQKWCFYGGIVGLLIMAVALLVTSKAGFISSFNKGALDTYGVKNAYASILAAGSKGGYTSPSVTTFAFGSTVLLIPMMVFFNLWSNWGATMYGEVRGAADFRKNVYAMGGAVLFVSITGAILLLLFSKTFGFDFYNAANNAYWAGNSPLPVWPYPGMFVAWLFGNPVLEFLFISVLALWFIGWVGTVFLSSTRAIFAAAFDRVLPEWSARVSGNGVPYPALALMLVPSIPISALYAYNANFATWTLDATLVIAISFLGTTIAAMILPWRRPQIYNASPIAKYRVLGLPLITAAGGLFAIFLIFCLYKWFQDDVYGVNNPQSLYYVGAMYVLAFAMYYGSRLYRRAQGVDLDMVYGEIPAE
jgi:basic amino acid/polyamine antiporter, APA family